MDGLDENLVYVCLVGYAKQRSARRTGMRAFSSDGSMDGVME
jgi:hypothetical protein